MLVALHLLPETAALSHREHLHWSLQMSTTTKHPYLTGEGPEGMGPLRHMALFQSHDVARGRAVHALHMPVVSRWAGCQVCAPLPAAVAVQLQPLASRSAMQNL